MYLGVDRGAVASGRERRTTVTATKQNAPRKTFRALIRELLKQNIKTHHTDQELAKIVNQRLGGKRDGTKYVPRDILRARCRYNRLDVSPGQRVPQYDEKGKALPIRTRPTTK